MAGIPEFVRSEKTISFLGSVSHALLTERMSDAFETELQAHHYAYCVRLDLAARPGAQTWTITFPDTYYFHLETIRAYYRGTPGALLIDVVDPANAVRLTHDPLSLRLITTPAEGAAARSTPLLYAVHFNHVFEPSKRVQFQIRDHGATEAGYMDLMAVGLYIPRAEVAT